jgi:spore maturation protein CgeB
MRALARTSLVDSVLKVSDSLRIYGVGMWQTYPEYARYYKGPVWAEDQVRQIYGSSRVNLHNAMTQMHTRALDCMSCGATIMVNRMLHNDSSEPDCLRAHFEPGVHYFEYGEDDLVERLREILGDEDRRRATGVAAAKAIREGHTWSHRVSQILDDLAQL